MTLIFLLAVKYLIISLPFYTDQVKIIHLFNPGSHNYPIFIPALTSFCSPLACSRYDIFGNLKKAVRPAIQKPQRNFTLSSAILVSLNYVLIMLEEYYSG